ncbi:MAG: hypothetical protein KDE31_02750, partial [Caldilineaceae bacterium]|nr:hypothetical protein [Caldilineaceae bacterium]
MYNKQLFYRFRHSVFRHGILLLLLAVALAGLTSSARGQSPICRDVGNLTICGEFFDELVDAPGGDFKLEKNLQIGPKGGVPVVLVTDFKEFVTADAAFIHRTVADPAVGATDIIEGEFHFINDAVVEPLFGSKISPDLKNLADFYFVDVVNQRIFNPTVGASPTQDGEGLRNEAMRLDFLDRTGVRALLKDGGSVEENAAIDFEIDIKNKKFNATIPMNLRLNDHAETPNLRLTTRITIDEQGNFSGGIDSFTMRLAGFQMDVQDVKIQAGSLQQSASFEAGVVDVRKRNNPGFPNLDPTNPELVFRLEKLRYKDGAWNLGGGTVPLPDWTVGDAFALRFQSAGLTFDDQSRTYTINLNTTIMSGGQDAPLNISQRFPVTLRLGARLVNGEFKPFMSTRLTSLTIPLSVSSMFLQSEELTMVMDPAGNFFGLTAERLRLQWSTFYGGQQSGALAGFRLGIDNKRDLVLDLQGGAVDLPEIKNKVFTG